MNLPVICLVTADLCSFCPVFVALFEKVESKLRERFKYSVVRVHKVRMNDPLADEYPADLERWIQWYPNLIIFDGKSWNDREKLKGDIFNGEFTSQHEFPILTKQSERTEDNILTWCSLQLSKYQEIMDKFIKSQALFKELLSVYHQFTMSPFWVRSESGLFADNPQKFIHGPGAENLLKEIRRSGPSPDLHSESWAEPNSQKFNSVERTDNQTDRKLFELYRQLGITDSWSFDRSLEEHNKLLSAHLNLLLKRYEI